MCPSLPDQCHNPEETHAEPSQIFGLEIKFSQVWCNENKSCFAQLKKMQMVVFVHVVCCVFLKAIWCFIHPLRMEIIVFFEIFTTFYLKFAKKEKTEKKKGNPNYFLEKKENQIIFWKKRKTKLFFGMAFMPFLSYSI